MTRYAPSGGKSPARQFMTADKLELSIHGRDECQTARKRMDVPTGFLSNPSEAQLKSWTPFIKDFLRKQREARAQHPPAGSEKTRDVRDDVNRVEKGQNGTSSVAIHSLSEITPQTHPWPPTPTRLTCSDAFLRVEKPSRASQSPSDKS